MDPVEDSGHGEIIKEWDEYALSCFKETMFYP